MHCLMTNKNIFLNIKLRKLTASPPYLLLCFHFLCDPKFLSFCLSFSKIIEQFELNLSKVKFLPSLWAGSFILFSLQRDV